MAKFDNPHRLALIPEHVSKRGGRLGRHIHFDERSRGYRVPIRKAAKIVTRTWARTIHPFDQGQTGSCTGNGAVGVICTEPYHAKGKHYTETLARKVYSTASRIDSIQGDWPPTDTGSTVLAAMKALKQLGWTTGYQWCFGLDDVLKTLSTIGPVEVGVNWYEGFDTPSASGLVKITGAVRGGHAFEILGVDAAKKTVIAENSWGSSYGVKGRFSFSWKDLDRLLKEQGEAATAVV
jgi:hypothetical protein